MKLMTALATTLFLTAGVAMATPPSGSTSAPTGGAAPAHHSLKHCDKEANTKNLKGEERSKFVKECQAAAKQK